MDELLEEVTTIRKDIVSLYGRYKDGSPAEEGAINIEVLCNLMYNLQEMRRDIATFVEEIESAIADGMNENIIFLPNGQQVERRVGADRKAWDHKSLAGIVAQRVYQSSVDMDTGEVLMTPVEMMTKMLEYAAPSYWRVKELDKLGVSADAFCEKSPGKTSIIISPLKKDRP